MNPCGPDCQTWLFLMADAFLLAFWIVVLWKPRECPCPQASKCSHRKRR